MTNPTHQRLYHLIPRAWQEPPWFGRSQCDEQTKTYKSNKLLSSFIDRCPLLPPPNKNKSKQTLSKKVHKTLIIIITIKSFPRKNKIIQHSFHFQVGFHKVKGWFYK
jgi:hypothetical protein